MVRNKGKTKPPYLQFPFFPGSSSLLHLQLFNLPPGLSNTGRMGNWGCSHFVTVHPCCSLFIHFSPAPVWGPSHRTVLHKMLQCESIRHSWLQHEPHFTILAIHEMQLLSVLALPSAVWGPSQAAACLSAPM